MSDQWIDARSIPPANRCAADGSPRSWEVVIVHDICCNAMRIATLHVDGKWHGHGHDWTHPLNDMCHMWRKLPEKPSKEKPKRLSSAVSEQYELEVGECTCGYHFGIDATFLDQVEDFRFNCPACGRTINTAEVFPA